MFNLKYLNRIALVGLFFSFATPAFSADLIMARVTQSFPETMVNLQSAIINSGYKISRVQRVDIGLTKSGYKTDKYRVVFFGKPEQIKSLAKKHPDLIPFLPLKISIFSENTETILVAQNPATLKQPYSTIPTDIFDKWENDLKKIVKTTQQSE